MEAPYILHALPSQTVLDFLSQRHNKLCHFISDIMDYFLAGEDQPQTNQPKDQAGGPLTCDVDGSSAEMLTKRAVLLLGSLELACRPGIFAILDFHEMDVQLIGYELTIIPNPGQRLVGFCLLLRTPYPLYTGYPALLLNAYLG